MASKLKKRKYHSIGTKMKITKLMYGWSKYGGGRHGLEKQHLTEWYCQSCGELQIIGLPSYMFVFDEQDERDFFRVCSKCKFLAIKNKIDSIFNLTRLLHP